MNTPISYPHNYCTIHSVKSLTVSKATHYYTQVSSPKVGGAKCCTFPSQQRRIAYKHGNPPIKALKLAHLLQVKTKTSALLAIAIYNMHRAMEWLSIFPCPPAIVGSGPNTRHVERSYCTNHRQNYLCYGTTAVCKQNSLHKHKELGQYLARWPCGLPLPAVPWPTQSDNTVSFRSA